MRFIKFTINGYRAIEETDVSISHNLRPIIGVNESGKTTILQAILAFDKNNDKYQGGKHLKYANRYSRLQKKEAKITAKILLENENELEKISQELKLPMGDEILKKLNKKLEEKEPISLSRYFVGNRKHYEIDNLDIENVTLNKKLANVIYEELPYILYFDDFSDRVPEEIVFKLDSENPGKYSMVGKSEEWHKLIEEMFLKQNSSVKAYLTMQDENDKAALVSDIADALDDEIISDWKELISKYGDEFSEESTNLKLKLTTPPINNNKLLFKFEVEDRTSSKGRFFNIVERSKGFQWFFNFTVKLKYNHKYKEERQGAIYLLDEPGSYLHTSAQEELLKKLSDISKVNTILYCTHSQFLLNPDIINVSKIIIAKKNDGKINAVPFKSSELSEGYGALAPLYKALHARIPYVENVHKYQIITEGIVEYYFLNIIKTHTKYITSDVVFIPGGGATQLDALISYAIAFTSGYKILLDSDKESRDAYDEYKDKFGSEEIKNFFKYKLKTKEENVIFEDYFSDKDKKHILSVTNTSDVKTGIVTLYFNNSNQKKIIEELDDETMGNLSILFGVINGVKK